MTEQALSSNSNAVFRISLHLVLVTKYRRRVLNGKILTRCCEILSATCARWEVECVECNGEADYVHALLEISPRTRPSDLVNNLKTVTSRRLRREFASVRNAYRKPVLWSPSYCLISAGGAPLSVLKEYIKQQATGKRSRT